MKNNLSYYRHEVSAHNHWKFKLLRKEYGWEGEGKFWALNNEIASSENCTLNLNDEGRKMSLCVDLDFSESDFEKYILFLCEKCKLILFIDGRIQTGITQENLGEVQEERKRKRDWMRKKIDVQQTSNGPEGTVQTNTLDVQNKGLDVQNEQSKVKKSKVKESIKELESLQPDSEANASAGETEQKAVYKKIAGDKDGLRKFIQDARPAFAEPYAKYWNLFAEENGFPKVEVLSDARRKKVRIRCREAPFDFVRLIEKTEQSCFDLTRRWLTFDWIVESQKNYTKLLEGNYDKRKENGTVKHITEAAGKRTNPRDAGTNQALDRAKAAFAALSAGANGS